ncbi:MAG TPA: DnaJ domain-containing protein [Cyclobacteriaceae bacterium]|nr:DnaJ domain-containing protein [Cyclobacteriaceae bacterium]
MKREIKNYYQILGLDRDATVEDIRKAYRTYAAKFHPDKHEGDLFFEERFKEVKEAYEVLSDIEKRWRYDVKTFGKSKVALKPNVTNFDRADKSESTAKRKLRIDVSHIDVYLTAFYFINLAAWAIIKRINENAAPGGYVWGLFLSALSSLLLWLFIGGIIERINRRNAGPGMYWVGYLVLALLLGYIILWTEWTL